jgi:hypothetical protein
MLRRPKTVILLAMLWAPAACGGRDSTPAGQRYPETRTVDVVDNYFGTKVPDPYRWLEEPDALKTFWKEQGEDSSEPPLIDEQSLPAGQSISHIWPSPDWRHAAYAISTAGSEWVEKRESSNESRRHSTITSRQRSTWSARNTRRRKDLRLWDRRTGDCS